MSARATEPTTHAGYTTACAYLTPKTSIGFLTVERSPYTRGWRETSNFRHPEEAFVVLNRILWAQRQRVVVHPAQQAVKHTSA